MRTLCFVTNEIYPEHKGGIGRLLYNMLVANAARPEPDRMFLLVAWQPPAVQEAVREALKGLAAVDFCPLAIGALLPWGQAYEQSNPPMWHYGHAGRQSVLYYACLLDMERRHGLVFDTIEFPDYSGWGLAAMEAKAAGLAFGRTELVVRLHSTSGLIARHQPFYHAPGPWAAAMDDMERQCLLKADLVVGHLRAVVDANRDHYGFPASWADRAWIEFPPLLIDDDERRAATGVAVPAEPDFIFSSRLQPFKQPDLFIRAAILFLRARPAYAGRCRLISYGWDDAYIAALKSLIPADLADRVVIETGLAPEARIAALAAGIVVIPSSYESLCLFAFEASHLAAGLILNGACAAFGRSDRWQDGVTALMFDGTAEGLAARMQDALGACLPAKASLAVTPAYWQACTPVAGMPAEPADIDLTVVAHGFSDWQAVAEMRSHIAGLGAEPLFLLPATMKMADAPGDCRFVPGARPWPADFAAALGACSSARIAFCRADTRFDPAFVPAARAAFGGNPALAAFGSHSRLVGKDGSARGIRLYAGSAPGVAMQSADILPDGAVFSVAVLRALVAEGRVLGPDTDGHWQSDLARELAFDRVPMVVAPAPLVTEVAPAVRTAGKAAIDITLMEQRLSRNGTLPGLGGLALRPLPRIALPDDPRLEVSMILKGASQLWPPTGRAVQYRTQDKDLIVHPFSNTWVLAALPITRADVPSAVMLQVQHFGHDNPGVDFALVCGPDIPTEAMMAALQKGEAVQKVTVGTFVTVKPGEQAEARLDLPPGQDFDWLAVAAKPTDGSTTSYAWTYVTRVWLS